MGYFHDLTDIGIIIIILSFLFVCWCSVCVIDMHEIEILNLSLLCQDPICPALISLIPVSDMFVLFTTSSTWRRTVGRGRRLHEELPVDEAQHREAHH